MIGILALHGGFAEHAQMLEELNLPWREVRSLADAEGLEGLVIPGGESTVMLKFLEEFGMKEWLMNFEGPVFGTCAGLIVLSRLGLINVEVDRNAYGRQLASFVTELEVEGVGSVGAHFIRAPKVTSVGEGVDVLAVHEEVPVLVRQGNVWGASFHPELAGDASLHAVVFG